MSKATQSKGKKKDRMPLGSEIWRRVYESLMENKVKFPKDFNGIGAAYAAYSTIEEVLKEYKIPLSYHLPKKSLSANKDK